MAKSPSSSVIALKFLQSPEVVAAKPVCVLAGDDAFLQHEVCRALTGAQDTEQGEGLSVETINGRQAQLRDVVDMLSERSLFGSGDRVVVVEDADPFVKSYREQLEAYVEKPIPRSMFILQVSSWPGNTRLAKAVARSGNTILCSVPEKGRELTEYTKQLKDWLIHQARVHHEVELQRGAADALVELLPPEAGLLSQEVARLALLTDKRPVIDAQLVRNHVGGWRVRKTWDMIDAVADGHAAEALEQLDRLIAAGEEPHALLAQMASTFRRFALAARLYEEAEQRKQRISLRAALEQSAMPAFKLSQAENQLKQIGRPRARQLYRWLLAADLELKGHNSTKDRARRVLETLILRMAKQAAPARPAKR